MENKRTIEQRAIADELTISQRDHHINEERRLSLLKHSINPTPTTIPLRSLNLIPLENGESTRRQIPIRQSHRAKSLTPYRKTNTVSYWPKTRAFSFDQMSQEMITREREIKDQITIERDNRTNQLLTVQQQISDNRDQTETKLSHISDQIRQDISTNNKNTTE